MFTDCSVEGTEKYGKQNEGGVPLVVVVDRSDAQEQEYYGLRAIANRLQSLVDGRQRSWGHILRHVILHSDTAKHDPDDLKRKLFRYLMGTSSV